MSLSKSKPFFDSELDGALEELYADFDKRYGTTSVSNQNSSSSNTTSCQINYNKRNNKIPAVLSNATKYRRLDDDEVTSSQTQKCIEDLEHELFNEYMTVVEEINHDNTATSNADGDDEDNGSDDEITPIPSCGPCLTSTKTKTHYKKSTDSDLKNYVFTRPAMSIGRCSADCKFGGNCVQATTIGDIESMVNDFWDDHESGAPSTATRRLKILSILRSSYRPNEDEFQFFAGCKEKNNRRICEAGFLILLGISNSPIASKAPGQWKRMKKYVSEGKDLAGIEYKSVSEEKLMKAENKSNKMKSALTFIEYFAKEFGDTIPGAEGGGKDIFVAPFVDIKAFWEEYCAYHSHQLTIRTDVAGLSTFSAAFKLLNETKGIKKLRSKGTFNTCEICNNASDLLRNKNRKLKHSQREIIQKFRQLHLSQQSREREFLDRRKLDAAKCDDAGNPLRLFLFGDGFTQYTCRTPKFPKESKGDSSIETRIVGIEVVCGPIKTVLVYRTDQLISGGANITIEMTRQALIDVSILLRQRSLLIPRTLWLQFDNCGDNKNKEFFAYYSLLVESYIFEEIEIAFLIVGHTHASIDQYFSVISRAIKRATFIGTPLALLELIRRCHDDSWHQPAIIREIKVYYDMQSMFAPYINKKIKYFNLPHVFKVIPSFGHVAICLYKTDSSGPWKPTQPKDKITDLDSLLAQSDSQYIQIPELAVVNGRSEFMKFLKLGDSDRPVLAEDLLGKDKEVARLTEVNKLLPDLEKLSLQSIQQQAERMHDESDGLDIAAAYEFRQEIQRKMLNENTKEEGYIIWLDLAKRKNTALPPIFEVLPYAFNPREGLVRTEEFSQDLRADDDGDQDRRNVDPKFKKKKQNGSRKLTQEDIFKRQLNAAKDISTGCRWVINEVDRGRIRNTLSGSFETSHFSDICITQGEMKWLQDHDSVEKVLSEVILAYSNAPKWEPFPKISLSLEDLQRIEDSKRKFVKEVEEAKKLAQALLVRLSDNAADNQHQMEYGEGSTEWIANLLKAKRQVNKSKKNPPASSLAQPTAVTKCSVTECIEPLVEGSYVAASSAIYLHGFSNNNGNTDIAAPLLSHNVRARGGRGRGRGRGALPPSAHLASASTTATTTLLQQSTAAESPAVVVESQPQFAIDESLGRNQQSVNGGAVSGSAIAIAPTVYHTNAAVLQLQSELGVTASSSVTMAPQQSTAPVVAELVTAPTCHPISVALQQSELSGSDSYSTQTALQQSAAVVPAIYSNTIAVQLQSDLGRRNASSSSDDVMFLSQVAEQTVGKTRETNLQKFLKDINTEALDSVGKPAQDLHSTLVKMLEAEDKRAKHKDFSGRLNRELLFTQYINPLAILSAEIYRLNLPQLMTPDVLEHVSLIPTIWLRDYKQFICSKNKKGISSFIQSFDKLRSLLRSLHNCATRLFVTFIALDRPGDLWLLKAMIATYGEHRLKNK